MLLVWYHIWICLRWQVSTAKICHRPRSALSRAVSFLDGLWLQPRWTDWCIALISETASVVKTDYGHCFVQLIFLMWYMMSVLSQAESSVLENVSSGMDKLINTSIMKRTALFIFSSRISNAVWRIEVPTHSWGFLCFLLSLPDFIGAPHPLIMYLALSLSWERTWIVRGMCCEIFAPLL